MAPARPPRGRPSRPWSSAALALLALILAGCTSPAAPLEAEAAPAAGPPGGTAPPGADERPAPSAPPQGGPGEEARVPGDASPEAWVEVHTFEGRYQCSATYLIVNGDCMALADGTARDQGLPVRPGDLTEDANTFFFPVRVGWQALELELRWSDAAAALPPSETGMRLAVEPGTAPAAHAARYAQAEGASPLALRLEAGARHPSATHERPVPVAEDAELRAVVYPTGALSRPGDTQLLGVGARLEQTFTLQVRVHYGVTAPEGGVATEDPEGT